MSPQLFKTLQRFARVYCLVGFAVSSLLLILGLVLASEQARDTLLRMSGELVFANICFGLGFAVGDFRRPGFIANVPYFHELIGFGGFVWSLKIYSPLMELVFTII